ncbi:transposase [Nocardia fluminea]|uniref:transposase n=1 Tax=Nocardia fluminea TaxID=134984 RepID=UPI0036687E1F
MDSRLVLQGILFVLVTGIGREDLPPRTRVRIGHDVLRWLRDWQAAGVFEQLHQAVLARSIAARSTPKSAALAAHHGGPVLAPLSHM